MSSSGGGVTRRRQKEAGRERERGNEIEQFVHANCTHQCESLGEVQLWDAQKLTRQVRQMLFQCSSSNGTTPSSAFQSLFASLLFYTFLRYAGTEIKI